MSPEAPDLEPLTPEQQEMAELFLQECGLQEVADEPVTMMGITAPVRYGLGRCANHLMGVELSVVKEIVMAKLDEQRQGVPPEA